MLTDSPSLAKVSSTPGKTRLVNHFLVNGSWYLVDLPGYGYARVSKSQRGEFSKLITDYVLRREQMVFLFVLLDSRHEPQKIDLRFIEMLGRAGVPFGLVFTKTDKLSADRLASNVARYRRVLLESWEELPPVFLTSSEKKKGPCGNSRFYRSLPAAGLGPVGVGVSEKALLRSVSLPHFCE